jgi:hypothetical protein
MTVNRAFSLRELLENQIRRVHVVRPLRLLGRSNSCQELFEGDSSVLLTTAPRPNQHKTRTI